MSKQHASQWIINALETHGQKITTSRRAVAEAIGSCDGIFSPGEIIDIQQEIDRVTVYRILDLFESLDIIHPVLTQHGEKHYEVHGQDHHHHVVCTGCEKASCIDCDVTRKKAKGFTHLHHSMVFTGLCESCTPA